MNCEPWEIELEYQIEQCLEEEIKVIQKETPLQICPACGSEFQGDHCTLCGSASTKELYVDNSFEEWEKSLPKDDIPIKEDVWEDVTDLEDVPNSLPNSEL